MMEWKVVIKTEKIINCFPDIVYVRNYDGKQIRLLAKFEDDDCRYHLEATKTNPELYILVHPYSIHNVYILCKVDGDVIYEELVPYDDVVTLLNKDVPKLITKQLYKEN